MLTVRVRCVLQLAPAPRGWLHHSRSLLAAGSGQLDTPSLQTRACSATPTQKIVRVRPAASRASSSNPPASSPTPPPPPPPPRRDARPPWGLVLAALAAGGSAAGVYYYTNRDKDKIKETVTKPAANATGESRRVPATIAQLPSAVQYLLVGGGTASFAAFRAIKSNQPKAQILVIGEEEVLPYMRPPLSKEIWRNDELPPLDKLSFKQWNGNQRSLYYESGAFYADPTTLTSLENGGVSVARGYTVRSVDPAAREVTVAAPGQPDKVIKYSKCLIATGVRPNNIPVLEAGGEAVRARCVALRTVRDAERLWARLGTARSVLVVGGGFLGSEMACALAANTRERGATVTQVYKETGNMAHVLPDYLAHYTTRQVERQGVRVLPNTEILKAYMKGERVALEMSSGETLEADVIVVGAGSTPNTELAATSGLETHPELGGLLVNAELQARTDLYAAGDVACFYDAALGRRRVEHHDHAVVSGRLAGENMAGAEPPRHYRHQSMFWSDLGPELGYEAIGLVDSSLPTVGVFAEASAAATAEATAAQGATQLAAVEGAPAPPAAPEAPRPALASDDKYERGVVFYLRGRRVVGVLMWNLFNRMHTARQLLAQGEEYDDFNEVAKLFQLHKE